MFLEYSDLNKKKVLIRTDYNVPIIENKIQSTKRIDETIKSIKFILNQNPKQLIIVSHLGRPNFNDRSLTLEPVRKYLESIIKKKIILCELDDIIKDKIVMIENIRFYREETEDLDSTSDFRKKLTNLCDVFVNDAFGCCHRLHSSIIGINVKEKYLGFLIQNEINYLSSVLSTQGVKTLILGGSKINDKIKLIENIIPKIDNIIIGGALAFTFLKHMNINIGDSLLENYNYELVDKIRKLSDVNGTRIILPVDFNCNDSFNDDGDLKYFNIFNGINDGYMGLDIGSLSILTFKTVLKNSNLIIWNGPLGVCEFDNFSIGSKKIMKFISKLNAKTVIAGGDTISCCEKFKLSKKMDHVSTGGNASLQMLEGNNLPGIKFITN